MYAYFQQDSAPAHTAENSMHLLQPLCNEWILGMAFMFCEWECDYYLWRDLKPKFTDIITAHFRPYSLQDELQCVTIFFVRVKCALMTEDCKLF